MGFDLGTWRADRNLQNEGNWVEDLLPDLHVKVRSTSSAVFKKRMAEMLKPFQKLGKDPTLEQQEEISRKVVAETILLDWEGVEVDGEKVPYTPENAEKIFEDIPDFLIAVTSAAGSLDTFKTKKDVEIEGNSETT